MKILHFRLMSYLLMLLLQSCHVGASPVVKTKVAAETLIIVAQGKIININLEENKEVWRYASSNDTEFNRNYFVSDESAIYLPFESGSLIALDINTGKRIWEKQISGNEFKFVQERTASPNDAIEEDPQIVRPVFMSKPLIHGDFLYIATAERAYGDTNPQLLCFNKKTGVQSWATALPTVFNYYAPVMYKDYVFVNSAVFLKKYNIQGGVDTSYGMFDGSSEYSDNATNRFENTIYHQMLADDNNIYIGDERGTIYCLQLNKYGDVKNADITDPNNTFVNNPKVFEWTFQHPEFTFQKNETAFLFNESYITEMKTGAADKSCIFSLDKDSGKEQWKVVIEDDLVDLYLSGNKLTTQNGKSIFVISASDGQLVHKIDIPADFTPVSNIDIKNDDTLFFLSASGVVKYNIKTKAFEVILHEKFDIDGQPYNQISYYAK